MQLAALTFVVIFGLCFGSFVTLASYRLPRGKGIVAGRSRCVHCSTALALPDLVPLLSWLYLRARCRHCSNPISARYPVIELITSGLFVMVYMVQGLSLASLLLMIMSTMLLIMVLVDLEYMIIPDEVHLSLLVLALGYHAAVGTPPGSVAAGFAAMLATGLALHHGYFYIRGREGLGYGDVKFFALAGVWLGLLPLLPFLFLSGLLGVATGLIWKCRGKGDKFPFAPSLALSLWVCVLWPQLGNILFL